MVQRCVQRDWITNILFENHCWLEDRSMASHICIRDFETTPLLRCLGFSTSRHAAYFRALASYFVPIDASFSRLVFGDLGLKPEVHISGRA